MFVGPRIRSTLATGILHDAMTLSLKTVPGRVITVAIIHAAIKLSSTDQLKLTISSIMNRS